MQVPRVTEGRQQDQSSSTPAPGHCQDWPTLWATWNSVSFLSKKSHLLGPASWEAKGELISPGPQGYLPSFKGNKSIRSALSCKEQKTQRTKV